MKDPYKEGMFKNNPYAKKKPVKGIIKVVLDGIYDERGLNLIVQPSRCLLKNEIHELILTTEEVKPGDGVNKIAYLGFFEVTEGSVAVYGDPVKIGGKQVGVIAGYDETHFPNHYNIVVKGTELLSGKDRLLELDMEVEIG
ncbi:DUF6917 domain-containing protein [Thermovenabulum gondwanense]|uniref:DUF6917 domain-containing protein n=1 Tax=Thermovenabulum gondwanense TaxID=520767 RepID=A0A162MIT7_9FIRM|nr:hypothetical protein [Thermovenabulum gondwanense]KYO66166.1 hypothetical protein ATZ99_13580 [Thermovenabulum gondwanense]